MTTDTRLGTLEGRAEEQTTAIADLREGQREIREEVAAVNRRIDGLSNRIDETNRRIDDVNKRIDRVFFALLGMGATQVAMIITYVVSS